MVKSDQEFAHWIASSTLPLMCVENPRMERFLKSVHPNVSQSINFDKIDIFDNLIFFQYKMMSRRKLQRLVKKVAKKVMKKIRVRYSLTMTFHHPHC